MPKLLKFSRPLIATLLLLPSAADAQDAATATTQPPAERRYSVPQQHDYLIAPAVAENNSLLSVASSPTVYRYYGQSQLQSRPRLIQTGQLSLQQKMALEEDLQVMNSLLIKGIAPTPYGAGTMEADAADLAVASGQVRTPGIAAGSFGFGVSGSQINGEMNSVSLFSPTDALGVTLSGRRHQMEITYLQGFGAIYSYRLAIPLIPSTQPNNDPEAAEENKPENEWDVARQQLFSPQSRSAFRARAANSVPQYNAAAVTKLIDGLKATLKHTARIRFPDGDERQIIVVLNGIDGGVVTVKGVMGADDTLETSVFQYTDASQQNVPEFSGAAGVATDTLLAPATIGPDELAPGSYAPAATLPAAPAGGR